MSNDIQNQVARVQYYGHPNIYPNSENIAPPVQKNKKRVVEAATRADVNMDIIKEFYNKQQVWLDIIKDDRIRKFLDNPFSQGRIVDIKI